MARAIAQGAVPRRACLAPRVFCLVFFPPSRGVRRARANTEMKTETETETETATDRERDRETDRQRERERLPRITARRARVAHAKCRSSGVNDLPAQRQGSRGFLHAQLRRERPSAPLKIVCPRCETDREMMMRSSLENPRVTALEIVRVSPHRLGDPHTVSRPRLLRKPKYSEDRVRRILCSKTRVAETTRGGPDAAPGALRAPDGRRSQTRVHRERERGRWQVLRTRVRLARGREHTVALQRALDRHAHRPERRERLGRVTAWRRTRLSKCVRKGLLSLSLSLSLLIYARLCVARARFARFEERARRVAGDEDEAEVDVGVQVRDVRVQESAIVEPRPTQPTRV